MRVARVVRRVVGPGVVLMLGVWPATGRTQLVDGRRALNAAYLEVLGNGGTFSLNYERALAKAAAFRIGVAMWTASDLLSSDVETTVTSIPVMAGWLRGSGANHLELGAGVVVGRKIRTSYTIFDEQIVESSNGFVSLTGTVGYRRQRPLQPGQRVAHIFRIGFTPFVGFGSEESAYPDRGFFPSVGVSYGVAF